MADIAFVVSYPDRTAAETAEEAVVIGRKVQRAVQQGTIGGDRVAAPSITRANATLTPYTAAQITALETAASSAAVLAALADLTELAVAGAAAGAVAVTGILTTDVLVKVYAVTEANPPTVDDLTAEFTISDDDEIDNTGGTSSAGETLLVIWYTPA